MGLAVTENKSSNRVTVKERVKLFVVMVICYLASWRSLFTFDIDLKITKLLQKSEMRKDIVIELSYKGFS